MMRRRVVVQRWPAVPTAPNTAAIKAIFRSASLLMMMALLPPNSNKVFPNRAPTVAFTEFQQTFTKALANCCAHSLAHAGTAGGRKQGNAGVVAHPLTGFTATCKQATNALGHFIFFEYFLNYFLTSQAAEGCFFTGFPNGHIAANHGHHGVPAPYSYREVES